MEERSPKKHGWRIALSILVGVVVILLLVYFAWFRPTMQQPLSEPLDLPTLEVPGAKTSNESNDDPSQVNQKETGAIPSNLEEAPVFIPPTLQPEAKPVCGEDGELLLLLVGIDYVGDGYLYGLADVIRVARVDFVNMTVNMVALPRDLIVEVPEGRFSVEDPMKINQAYLFGTPGMGHYNGTGKGASSLAEVIQYNFGVSVDHYAVVNFSAIVKFIDVIGGVEVDLPGPVTDPTLGDFQAGKQLLNGERALALARIRQLYSDAFRVSNQTLILRAALNKLIQPATIVKVPGLIDQFKDAFLTDLSLEQLSSLGLCFLNNFDSNNLRSFQVPSDLVQSDWAYIPTLSQEAYVYRWDQRMVEWVHEALLSE